MGNKLYEADSKIYFIETIIVYFILFCGIFSDLLRINGTSITLYRLLLPVAIVIMLMNTRVIKKFFVYVCFLSIITFIQYIIFFTVAYPEMQFDFECFITAYVMYGLAGVFVSLIAILKEIDNDFFYQRIMLFIEIVGGILCAISLTNYFFPYIVSGLTIDNINNYSCYFVALIAVLLIQYRKSKNVLILLYICILCLAIYINDSKASLFGLVFMFGVFICVSPKIKSNAGFVVFRFVLPLCFLFTVIIILIINPHIHGYTLRGTISDPIMRIIENRPYDYYNTSISYRTNTTIFSINQFIHMGGIGVGIGNTGRLLGEYFPNTSWGVSTSSSLHNAWLELLLDGGIIILVLYIIVIVYSIRLFFRRETLKDIEVLRVIFVMSLPIWIIGPSGIYTMYYLFAIFSLIFMGCAYKRGKDE